MLRFIYCQPLWLIFLIAIAFIGVIAQINTSLKKSLFKFIFNVLLLAFSLLVLIYITVLSRDLGNYQIELRPFYTFVMAQVQPEYYRTFFMNCLLFVPIGLSMPYLLGENPHKRNLFITIGFAAVLSAVIEFLQYYYHLGRCETDDVIANTLGAAVGTLSYCLYMRILKNQEKGSLMHNTINDNQKLLLKLCEKSLFKNDIYLPEKFNGKELIKEANRQTVFTLIYSHIKKNASDNDDKCFSQIIANNIRVEYAHNEIHDLFLKSDIPYVILKGVASAVYYNEPMLRTMGDVDVLVASDNIAKADKLLKSIGFVTADDIHGDDMHIGYKRKDGIVCELHRAVNGIPKNEAGEKVQKYLADILEKSFEYKTSNGSCVVPCKFHHGLVLLLHTASHLTNEGVGLRHLCDWAVFSNSLTNDEFISLFEKALKEMGLWRFAQLLTLCCVKYLACDAKSWAGEADDTLLDGIIADILNGGNFGYKDIDRYNQIKYLSNREMGTVGKRSLIMQLLSSINAKTKKEFGFVNKSKLLLPVGWLFIVCKYFYMVITGNRTLDSRSTITVAKQRKEIYDEFKLFSEE